MADDPTDDTGDWTNVSVAPHKPYHVQQNTTSLAYRWRDHTHHSWVDGLPPGWVVPPPATPPAQTAP